MHPPPWVDQFFFHVKSSSDEKSSQLSWIQIMGNDSLLFLIYGKCAKISLEIMGGVSFYYA